MPSPQEDNLISFAYLQIIYRDEPKFIKTPNHFCTALNQLSETKKRRFTKHCLHFSRRHGLWRY